MGKTIKTKFVFDGKEHEFTQHLDGEKTEKAPPKEKKPKEEKRDRKFCLTSYIDKDYLYQFLKRAEWVQHWALCTHNQDKNEDGTPKEVHTHIVLYTYNAKTASAVKKLFDRYSAEIYRDSEPQNTLSQICFDMVTQWRYLIHADDKEKFQYSDADRYCDNYGYWHNLEVSAGLNDSAENIAFAMLQDFMSGMHPVEMTKKYGKDFLYHLSHLQKASYEIYKRDGLTQNQGLDLREYSRLCLENCPFNAEVINHFWVALDYILSQCQIDFNSQIEFYLTERNERK